MAVSLDDRYALESGRVYLSGVQALVRLSIEQSRRDRRAGLNTAGFVSGYRGSPLGGFDSALWQAARFLEAHDIRFEPGLNEELAATAVAGSQQIGLIGGARHDGVFGLWYAKNPGVDRAADALKHANANGTSMRGGVLAVSGDDPGASSSTLPNQCDQAFIAALMPVLEPAGIADVIELGLVGFALSRYSGLWVGFKTVADVIEGSASVEIDAQRPSIADPGDFALPPGGLNIRWPDNRWDQDSRLLQYRLPAAQAFARANRVDRLVMGRLDARIGIVASGKAWLDLCQGLDDLGIDKAAAIEIGLAVYKVGMPWPLDPHGMREFAQRCEELFVIEERRPVIEPQIKDLAYNWPAGRRPRIIGKTDEAGAPLLPTAGELSPVIIARALCDRLARHSLPQHIAGRLAARIGALIAARGDAFTARRAPAAEPTAVVRVPHFCAGCPHSRSTRLPDGSLAMAGIGCHSLRMWMPGSATVTMAQMGGEGANWIGLAPFVDARHVFQNLGDGTYCHSGTLAIRAAMAAKSNITFRILFNEATAMTGGQPVEGGFTVAQITRQLAAEGVKRVAVVTDEPRKYRGIEGLAPGVTVHDRDDLDHLQRELRSHEGVTAMVYDQACATEVRRRRKRGTLPAAPARAYINERVCEGCGDCVEQSQCAAVMPVETPLGRKRRIDQSACNADLSCVDGFCPSFVTIEGGELRRDGVARREMPVLPAPAPPALDRTCSILINGIGGAGVVTAGAILGMAAHLEGRGCTVLDNTGIARKGGAVSTHVRLGRDPSVLHAGRIGEAAADLVIAADMLVSTGAQSLSAINPGRTRVIANSEAVPTLNQRLDPDSVFNPEELRRTIETTAGAAQCDWVEAEAIASHLAGDAIYANMVLLGFAFQRGLIPLGAASIDRAIELNGAEVEANRRAFALGRSAAHQPREMIEALRPFREDAEDAGLDAMVARRVAFLTAYQDAGYAKRYAGLVARVRAAEGSLEKSSLEKGSLAEGSPAKGSLADGSLAMGGAAASDALTRAVAQSYFRLLAIKDEYEVARLYRDGGFQEELARRFSGSYRVRYHFAPPLLARTDPRTGHLRKRAYGPWMGRVLGWIAPLKGLRGTVFDPFGWSAERRMERRLISDYETTIATLLARLDRANLDLAAQIAALPQQIRGFGHVKARNAEHAKIRESELLARYQAGEGG